MKLASRVNEVEPPEANVDLEGVKQRVDLVPGKVPELPPDFFEQDLRVSLLPVGRVGIAAGVDVDEGEKSRLPEVVQAADTHVLGEPHHLQKDDTIVDSSFS